MLGIVLSLFVYFVSQYLHSITSTLFCYIYASVHMHQRHMVVSLCVILYVCNSIFSEVAIN